jgi:hypothetical protein
VHTQRCLHLAAIIRVGEHQYTDWYMLDPSTCAVQRHFKDLQRNPGASSSSTGYAQAVAPGKCSSVPSSSRVRPYSSSGSSEEQARLSNLSLAELVALEQASELQAEQRRRHS